MADERKRRRWLRWVAVLLVLYPFSIAPAAWLCESINPDKDGWPLFIWSMIYLPMLMVAGLTGTGGRLIQYIDWFFALCKR